MPLTAEERRRIQLDLGVQEEEKEKAFNLKDFFLGDEPPFPADLTPEGAGPLGTKNLFRQLGNTPRSFVKQLTGIGSFVGNMAMGAADEFARQVSPFASDTPQAQFARNTASTLALGPFEEANRRLTGTPEGATGPGFGADTPRAQNIRRMGQEFGESFSPERVVNEPMDAVGNALAVVGGGAGAMGRLGGGLGARGRAVSQQAARVDPVNLAIEGGVAGAKKARDWIGQGGAEVSVRGANTLIGTDSGALRQLLFEGVKGNRKAIKRLIENPETEIAVLEDVQTAALEIRNQASEAFKRGLAELTRETPQMTPAQIAKFNDIRTRFIDRLESDFDTPLSVRRTTEAVDSPILDAAGRPARTTEKVTESIEPNMRRSVFSFTGEPEAQFRALLDRVTDHGQLPDDFTLARMQNLKEFASGVFMPDKRIGALVTGFKQDLKELMADINPRYPDVAKDFDDADDFLTDVQAILGVKRSGDINNKETAFNKLSRSLDEGRGLRRGLLERISAQRGSNLPQRIAAQSVSGTTPRGLVGRFAVAGAMPLGGSLGLGAGGSVVSTAAGALLGALVAIPLTNPQRVGKRLLDLGATAGQANEVLSFVERLRQAANAAGLPTTITIGDAMGRLEEPTRRPSILQRLRGVR